MQLTSRRNILVGMTIPAPTELRNDSKNLWKENFLNSFSDSFATFPAPAKTCPWTPRSLNQRNGRSNEMSANAETARSPPIKSLPEDSEASWLELSLTCLLGSVGPSPLVLNPQTVAGPPRVQTGEKSPPRKNRSGRDEGLFRNPFPQGKITPPETPKLSAAW